MVNDMDSIIAIKYTYKGISGIGERTNQVSQIYRNVDISHIGRIDPDTSSNSDPGLTGSLCPLTKLYDNSNKLKKLEDFSMANAPKITRITIDNVKYDIDLPSDASPVIDSLEVTRQLIVPVIDDSSANNLASMAANKGYVDTKNADLQKQIDTIDAGKDVADIVGTKAELNSYDTSKLTDGDVIKVLADETLNNAIVYYKWTNSS